MQYLPTGPSWRAHGIYTWIAQHYDKCRPEITPRVPSILCAEKCAAEAHYALDNLPSKILAAKYQTMLPDEKLITEDLERSRQRLGELRLSDVRA
jgi:hypothetical protein